MEPPFNSACSSETGIFSAGRIYACDSRFFKCYEHAGSIGLVFRTDSDSLNAPKSSILCYKNRSTYKLYLITSNLFIKVIGFDSVDDESIPELTPFNEDSETPSNWTQEERPTYSYYIYYMFCNIMTLNHLRRYVEFKKANILCTTLNVL